jgi:hypothetical protein
MRYNHRARDGWFDEGIEVIVVEQQGVSLWGRDAEGRYLERQNETSGQWRVTGETTEEFWLHVAAFEAASCLPANRSAQALEACQRRGGQLSRSADKAEAIHAIEGATQPLPCSAWTWPGTHQVMRHRRHDLRGWPCLLGPGRCSVGTGSGLA